MPSEIGQLTNLRELSLRHNQLTQLPPEIGQLTNLRWLSLYKNQFTGPVLSEIGQLTKLENLDLSHNQLTQLPPEIGQLTNLQYLDLESNQLTGPIPPEIGQLTNLKYLLLEFNQLTGSIPPEIGQLTNLKTLHIYSNQLTGPIPTHLDQLTNLAGLDLSGNQLTGPLPPEISQLTNLYFLELSCNALTGPIPSEILRLTRLGRLYLDGNHLTGAVPPELEDRLWPAFCDDEDSGHEGSIENLARWGIIRGCGNSNYCPGNPITRSQMAALLHRAVSQRHSGEPAPVPGTNLGDVEEDAWYRRYAEWAVGAGVMKAPNGRFDPGGAVTRADMAEMLTAAFDHITPLAEARGIFTDMAGQPNRVVRAAEGLQARRIAKGCSENPLRYCPDQPVTRAQTATFFYRTLNYHPPGWDYGFLPGG